MCVLRLHEAQALLEKALADQPGGKDAVVPSARVVSLRQSLQSFCRPDDQHDVLQLRPDASDQHNVGGCRDSASGGVQPR
jgi:hypothetical protein